MVLGAGALTAFAQAQTTTPTPTTTTTEPFVGKIHFTGVLQGRTATGWQVSQLSVGVNADTKIHGDPAVGAIVAVDGTLSQRGAIVAKEIKVRSAVPTVPPAPFTGEIELTGILDDKSATVWHVSTLPISVNERTKIEGDAVVGSLVKVHGTLDETGTIVAKTITSRKVTPPVPQLGRIHFSVVVQEQSAAAWKVSGLAVAIDRETGIKGDPKVGDMVLVHGTLDQRGHIVAKQIVGHGRDSDGKDKKKERPSKDRDDDRDRGNGKSEGKARGQENNDQDDADDDENDDDD